MVLKKQFSLYALIFLSFIVALIMLGVNRYWYGFPGVFYFEPTLFSLVIFLYVLRLGLTVQFPNIIHTSLWKILSDINMFSLIIVLILFGTTAVQYTPFSPIDKNIVTLERLMHLDLQAVIAWTNANGLIRTIAAAVYSSLGYQIFLLPILVILAGQYDHVYKFYFLILTSWLIGISLYYFFPTQGPASVIDSPYFVEAQRFTGLKFWQLHHYIQPTTSEGGMIAMPSFHVIWGWLCVYILRPWSIAFNFLFLINSVMVASCVMLGWHYFLDVVGSSLTLLTAHTIYYLCHKQRAERSGCKAVTGQQPDLIALL